MSKRPDWADAESAARKVGKPRKRTFEEYLALAKQLAAVRAHLLDKTGLTSDASPIFREAFAKFVSENPWIRAYAGPSKESFRSASYFVAANEAAIAEWLTALPERERARMRHPEVVRREYIRAQRPPTEPLTTAQQLAELRRENAALRRENAKLKASLAKAERDAP